MPSYVTPKINTEYIFYMGLPSQGTAGTFQANATIAAGDFKVSTDGGALSNLDTIPAVTPASGKMVKITLSTTEMNGNNVTVIASDAAGDEWYDVIVNIATTAQQIDDLSTQTSVNTIDTVVDAILIDTAEIGTAGAGLTALATQTSVDTVDSNVDAIKITTDKITFTVANKVDSNVKSVNDVTVTGDGETGTEWGPA